MDELQPPIGIKSRMKGTGLLVARTSTSMFTVIRTYSIVISYSICIHSCILMKLQNAVMSSRRMYGGIP